MKVRYRTIGFGQITDDSHSLSLTRLNILSIYIYQKFAPNNSHLRIGTSQNVNLLCPSNLALGKPKHLSWLECQSPNMAMKFKPRLLLSSLLLCLNEVLSMVFQAHKFSSLIVAYSFQTQQIKQDWFFNLCLLVKCFQAFKEDEERVFLNLFLFLCYESSH